MRCTIDAADDKINAKVKRAHEQKVPFMAVVGPAEQEADSVMVRVRGQKEQVNLKVGDFVERLARQVADRQGDLAGMLS